MEKTTSFYRTDDGRTTTKRYTVEYRDMRTTDRCGFGCELESVHDFKTRIGATLYALTHRAKKWVCVTVLDNARKDCLGLSMPCKVPFLPIVLPIIVEDISKVEG